MLGITSSSVLERCWKRGPTMWGAQRGLMRELTYRKQSARLTTHRSLVVGRAFTMSAMKEMLIPLPSGAGAKRLLIRWVFLTSNSSEIKTMSLTCGWFEWAAEYFNPRVSAAGMSLAPLSRLLPTNTLNMASGKYWSARALREERGS